MDKIRHFVCREGAQTQQEAAVETGGEARERCKAQQTNSMGRKVQEGKSKIKSYDKKKKIGGGATSLCKLSAYISEIRAPATRSVSRHYR